MNTRHNLSNIIVVVSRWSIHPNKTAFSAITCNRYLPRRKYVMVYEADLAGKYLDLLQ